MTETQERINRLKFDLRQAMIDYGAAERANDPERIRETSTRGCALIDSLAPIAAQRDRLTDADLEALEIKHAPPVHPDFLGDDGWEDFARAVERLCAERWGVTLHTTSASTPPPGAESR